MEKYKKYSIVSVSFMLILTIGTMLITYIIDPYFHYHAPNENFNYSIDNQRYQNNGILYLLRLLF